MGSKWESFKGWLLATRRHEAQLVEQAFVNLDSRLATIRERQGETLRESPLVAAIEERLRGERTWDNAQHAEQLMMPLLSDEELTVELARLKHYATGSDGLREIAETLDEGPEQLALKRALVERLLKEMHWDYERRRLGTYYKRCIRRRMSIFFAMAFAAFFAPDRWPRIVDTLFKTEADPMAGFVFAVVTAGLLGACISMLSNLAQRLAEADLDGLRSLSSFSFLFFRVTTGAAGSLVLFYFLRAGLISEEMVPDLSDFTAVSDADTSLLIVLSFAAGFSEKLVARVLQGAQEKIGV